METAKAVVDVPSPYTGKVTKLHGAAGDIIETGAALAEFEPDPNAKQRAEAESTGHHHGPKKSVGTGCRDRRKSSLPMKAARSIRERHADREDEGTVVGAMISGNHVHVEQAASVGGVKAVPAVRALAKKLKVDIARVTPYRRRWCGDPEGCEERRCQRLRCTRCGACARRARFRWSSPRS
jgi:2-oxoisovalerate dehydrogenase E2 component (dihydrolipoyl transacylase)